MFRQLVKQWQRFISVANYSLAVQISFARNRRAEGKNKEDGFGNSRQAKRNIETIN